MLLAILFIGFTALPKAQAMSAIDCYKIGKAYYYGQGVKQNYYRAARWLLYSANMGNKKAQHLLKIYEEKIGEIPSKESRIKTRKMNEQRTKMYYKKALLDLTELKFLPKGSNAAVSSLGLSKLSLRRLVFNVIQPDYYNTAVGIFNNVYSVRTTVVGGNPYGVLSQFNNATNAGNISLSGLYNKFMNTTSNRAALYYAVNNYYAAGLQSRYGNFKTNFLKLFANKLGGNMDISYQTILENANEFLSAIPAEQRNINAFNKLLGYNFKAQKFDNNGIPMFHYKFGSGTAGALAIPTEEIVLKGMVHITRENKAEYEQITNNYPVINSKSLNFFSLVNVILQDNYGKGNISTGAGKMLEYLVLGEKDKFIKLIEGNSFQSIQTKFTFINIFLKDLNSGKFKSAKTIMFKVWTDGNLFIDKNPRYASVCGFKAAHVGTSKYYNYPPAYMLMEVIYNYYKFAEKGKNKYPWDKAVQTEYRHKMGSAYTAYKQGGCALYQNYYYNNIN